MGFSFKIVPGVRIRASSRGLRASVGPRAARVHFGSGPTGFSTGAGPVGFYTSLGGGRSAGRGRGGSPSVASYQRQLASQQRQTAAEQKAEQAQILADTFLHIINLHRVAFTPASRPVLPAPALPDRAPLFQHYEQETRAGISVFNRRGRKLARQRAAELTEAEVQRQFALASEEHAARQQYFDDLWQKLCANNPDVVMGTLNEAFEDNEAPSLAVGVDGNEAALVVLVPEIDASVPERMPTTTQAGNLSLKKLTQRDRADYYKFFVCGHMVVTVREAFAVAPALVSARVVVLRDEGADAYGQPKVSCLAAAKFDRAALERVQWETADAVKIVNDVATEKVIDQRGRTQELSPIDLSREPELEQLVRAVDLTGLTSDSDTPDSSPQPFIPEPTIPPSTPPVPTPQRGLWARPKALLITGALGVGLCCVSTVAIGAINEDNTPPGADKTAQAAAAGALPTTAVNEPAATIEPPTTPPAPTTPATTTTTKTTTKAAPKTTTSTKKPAPTTATTVAGYVTAGAFCSPKWAFGHTSTGKLMQCKPSSTDTRFRWRAV